MIQLITLALALLILVIFAGGILPLALYAAVGVLAIGAAAVAWKQRRKPGKPRKAFVAMAAISIAWVGFTALPLPDRVLGVHHETRNTKHETRNTKHGTRNTEGSGHPSSHEASPSQGKESQDSQKEAGAPSSSSITSPIQDSNTPVSSSPSSTIPALQHSNTPSSTGSTRSQIYVLARQAMRDAKAGGLTKRDDYKFSISLNRAGTLRIMLLLIGAWAAAFLASSMNARQKFWLLRGLIGLGIVMAAAGIFGRYVFPPGESVWWFLDVNANEPMAAFVSANHYGAFLAMLVPAVLSQAVRDFQDREYERMAVWVAAMIVITAGVVSSESRGAFICLAAALTVTGLLFMMGRRPKASGALAVCVVIAIIALAGLSTPEMDQEMGTLHRLKDRNTFSRVDLWNSSLEMVNDFPVIGVGAEGFRTLSPHYNPASAEGYFHHAESTYMQVLCDFGVLGCLWGIGLLTLIGKKLWDKVRAKRFSLTLMVASAGAVLVFLLHGLYDFGFHVPLYGVIAAIYFGILVGRPAGAHRHKKVVPEEDPKNRFERLLVPVGFALALAVAAGVYGIVGEDIYPRDKQWYVQQAGNEQLAANLSWTPGYWANWYYLGRQGETTWTLHTHRHAERWVTRAAALNPDNALIWQNLTQLRRHLGLAAEADQAYGRYVEALVPGTTRRKQDSTTESTETRSEERDE